MEKRCVKGEEKVGGVKYYMMAFKKIRKFCIWRAITVISHFPVRYTPE